MYHQIVSGAPEDLHAVTVEAFAHQMHWLHEHRYQGVPIETLLLDSPSQSNQPNSRLIAITFDDGYLDFYTNAFPILQQYGFKATVFLVAERIGRVNDWDQAPEQAGAPILDWSHIQILTETGISFGAHTCTHPDLTQVPISQAAYEIRDSRIILEQKIQRPVNVFAYPYSRYNDAILKLVIDNGFDLACTYVPHYVGGSGKHPYTLQRTGILSTDTLNNFIGKVQARPRWRLYKFWRDLKVFLKNSS